MGPSGHRFNPMNPQILDAYHGDRITSFHDVASAGIQLTIFKCSQGLSTTDDACDGWTTRARSCGLLTGAYHFLEDSDGMRQADWFLHCCPPGSLMVLDFERYSPSQASIDQAEHFVYRIHESEGVLPVLYYGDLLLEADAANQIARNSILRGCPGWGSRYDAQQVLVPSLMDLVMWQYTSDGVGPMPHTLPGVRGNCDLSVWVGDPSDIPAFVAKHGRPK